MRQDHRMIYWARYPWSAWIRSTMLLVLVKEASNIRAKYTRRGLTWIMLKGRGDGQVTQVSVCFEAFFDSCSTHIDLVYSYIGPSNGQFLTWPVYCSPLLWIKSRSMHIDSTWDAPLPHGLVNACSRSRHVGFGRFGDLLWCNPTYALIADEDVHKTHGQPRGDPIVGCSMVSKRPCFLNQMYGADGLLTVSLSAFSLSNNTQLDWSDVKKQELP
jgi:hypothetical protein